METDGTQDARGTHAAPVPRPAEPPRPPAGPPPTEAAHPPKPTGPPPRPATAVWLDQDRPEAPLGIWRPGYRERVAPVEDDGGAANRGLSAGLLISLLAGLFVWLLWSSPYNPYRTVPLKVFTPDDWWWSGSSAPRTMEGANALVVYHGLVFAVVAVVFGRLGGWPEAQRRFLAGRRQPSRALLALLIGGLALVLVWTNVIPVSDPVLALVTLVAGPEVFRSNAFTYALYLLISAAVLYPFARAGDWAGLITRRGAPEGPAPGQAPADAAGQDGPAASRWPVLRAAGQDAAAERLTGALEAGLMNDVDCARIRRRWRLAGGDGGRVAAFAAAVQRHGAAAFTHPSGSRDLPFRRARHDLLTGQVRLGRCADENRNGHPWRGAGFALEPDALTTSLLAVGPPGAGKTAHLVAPVVESLALGALTGSCAVIAVCAAGTPLGPDDGYDVVVRLGDPESGHDLDLYAGSTDADEAAAFLADGLAGDLDGFDTRRAATVLAQLLGPFRAVHTRFPTVPELRELLHRDPGALAALRERLADSGDTAMQREYDTYLRQSGHTAELGAALADRVALLDRPAFADFFGRRGDERPFSLRDALTHPMRVRVDLPERLHEEASRLLARLLLAQFTALAAAGPELPRFTCLVLDDASRTLTPGTIRGVQRLRPLNAGVVLALRTTTDVPEQLHGALHGAVGCRAAFSGLTTWDGRAFTEAWGTEWVDTEEVAKHTVYANQPLTRAMHALRKLVTGRAVTTDAVTVRRVERARWSASELAHSVPPAHAVLSLNGPDGKHTPPMLVDFGDQA
ncbi:ATP/GTP-binding protein [Streptomyces sp. NPDC058045]|uniref:ATP/GTP-binding protein n=1 Tax=Streptomyces sp. NPDC058045 TaxID=3346311 RepID=UPI0036EAACF5